MRVAEIEPLKSLGHDDRRAAVGIEVHVVGVVYRNRLSRLAGHRVDGRQAPVGASLRIVGHPERLEVP